MKIAFSLGAVFLCLVPYEVEGQEHTNCEQITRQFGDIQHRIGIGQIHVGLLIEGLGGTMYQRFKILPRRLVSSEAIRIL